MDERICEFCDHFVESDEYKGYCFRFPPQVFAYNYKGKLLIDHANPEIDSCHWCGEFKKTVK